MSVNEHHYSISHQLFRIKHTELNEIFLVMSLRAFVCSMISIFIPIYLYNLGYSIRDILLVNLIMYATEFLVEYYSAKLRTEFGPKHAIALSMPFLIAHFWLFSTLPIYHWPLWFPAICGGIHLAIYWQAYHYDFSRSKHKGQGTKDVSKMFILLAIVGTVAPLIGGLIAAYFGFGALYLIVIFSLLLVFLPLLKKGEQHIPVPFDPRKLKIRDIWVDLVSNGGTGMEAAANLVSWPLFVYLIVKTYQSVGIITSVALILTVLASYIVGKKVTNANRHKYIRNSSFADGLLYTMFIFVDSFLQVAALNLIQTFVGSLRTAPYISEYYLHADDTSRSEYVFYMESANDAMKVVMYLILIFATFYLDVRSVLIIGLLFGAVGAMLAGLMPRSKCEIPYRNSDQSIKVIPKLRSIRETNR